MFSESSTGSWAEQQLPCCTSKGRGASRKHVTKPFTQPAAPDCRGVMIPALDPDPEYDFQLRIQKFFEW